MTGNLERPSQETQEKRKADLSRDHISLHTRARRAVGNLHAAEFELLVSAQRAARSAALHAIDAALSARHASAAAAVVGRFADLRGTLACEGGTSAAAALRRLAGEEATELSRLALAHAAEKRALKRTALLGMLPSQKDARQALRRASRRRRVLLAIAVHGGGHSGARIQTARAQPCFKLALPLR